jgi:anti-sigma factor RsiW
MDCDTYHELIVADLADTLSPSERETVRAHLDDCVVCRNARALEAEFAAHLRRGPRLVETPVAVQERLRVALTRERLRPPSPVRPRILAGAAAAALLGALALGLLRPAGADFIGPVTDDYALAATARLPLDVTTSDPAVLARYFDDSGRFGFTASVFDLHSAGYRLIGGAIREHHGVVFAVSVYARDGEIITCHRFRDPEGGTAKDAAIRRYLRTRDLGTWITRHAGVVCCLTSRMPPEEFERIVPAAA